MRSERGFTLTEMMIATGIMLAVTAAVFDILNPAQGTFQAQPEVADMQQRLRVSVDGLAKDLVMAGAGTYTGASAGALYNYFAPVMPYRTGDTLNGVAPDVPGTFKADTISIMYVPPTPAQTTIRDNMPKTSSELKVNAQPNCPPDKSDQLCGFKEGMRILIFDGAGNYDPITITHVQDAALHLQYDGELSVAYAAKSYISQVATHTYYLKKDVNAKTYELRHFDGYQTDLPVVDNVVDLQFEYFGDPQPPRLLPNKALTDTVGPWTTYGPKPPPLTVDNAADTWPVGENCAFKIVSGQHQPRLAVLGGGGIQQVKLDSSIFTDGEPFCADATKKTRYDADLLRIRRVRVKLRVQAALESLRSTGPLFLVPGTSSSAERYVPDQQITFDITPRNLNLGR